MLIFYPCLRRAAGQLVKLNYMYARARVMHLTLSLSLSLCLSASVSFTPLPSSSLMGSSTAKLLPFFLLSFISPFVQQDRQDYVVSRNLLHLVVNDLKNIQLRLVTFQQCSFTGNARNCRNCLTSRRIREIKMQEEWKSVCRESSSIAVLFQNSFVQSLSACKISLRRVISIYCFLW